jgi:fido (protein-threonine AMPylation protein)
MLKFKDKRDGTIAQSVKMVGAIQEDIHPSPGFTLDRRVAIAYNCIEFASRTQINTIIVNVETIVHDEPLEAVTRLERRLAARLIQKKAELDSYRPLRQAVLERLHEDLRIRLTYHSNAIEGNTLSLRETQLVIEEGITIGGHTMREHLEATNHAEAYDAVRVLVESHAPITIETILALHALVLGNIHSTAGQFRTQAVYIRGSDLMPPHSGQVPGLMREWVAWLSGEGLRYDPVVRAAIAHHGFVAVHPFEDGNGRTGRLLLNLLLLREGYAPAFVLRSWAERYRSALGAADHGRYTALVNLIGLAVEAGLDFYLDACHAHPEEQYQPLPDLAKAMGRDANYLGLLARQGKLEARKQGARWYSTEAAVLRYTEQAREGLHLRGRPRLRAHSEEA